MRSRWQEEEARRWVESCTEPDLGLRVYTSRLLGAEPALVLAGGGNTSVKTAGRDLHGVPRPVLWVKGSGSDLATIEAGGFAPIDLEAARRLLSLERLSDGAMLRELRRLRLDPEAPTPSIETLLHAFLPFRFVDHSHADAVLAVTQTTGGRARAVELWGEDHLIVPYVMPGFELARVAKRQWEEATAAGRRPVGMILLHHGVFTFADDARESYERMLRCVARAERVLRRLPRPGAGGGPAAGRRRAAPAGGTPNPAAIAALRRGLSDLAGRPLVLAADASAAARRLLADPSVTRAALRGPLTPDHALRTKRVPLVVADPAAVPRALAGYARAYQRYFERWANGRPLRMLDRAPRVVLVPGHGLYAAGESAAAAHAALEICRHTLAAAAVAERLGGYRPLPAGEVFEIEYWELEQAKLARAGVPAPLAGRVALVTGAARGIGRACVEALLARGAAVVGLDLLPTARPGAAYLGLECDATDRGALGRAVGAAVAAFGGIDIAVSNVGVFAASPTIEDMDEGLWRRALEVNVTAHFLLLRELVPLLKVAVGGGAVVVIGSKNVAAPGPGAAAYSASKAALTQLARVAALELAPHGVRVNVLHPDGVFDTGLWTPEVLAQRAARYGLSVDAYRRRNLLGREVTAADVGALAAALAGDLFAKTTGAQIPIDGGNDRVI